MLERLANLKARRASLAGRRLGTTYGAGRKSTLGNGETSKDQSGPKNVYSHDDVVYLLSINRVLMK